MDDLAAAFSGSFAVNTTPNDVNTQHPRFSQYKQKYSGSSQEERRQNMLQSQKKKRFDSLAHIRRLTHGNWDDDADGDEICLDVDSSGHYVRSGKHYRNQLMLSEWLVEVPDDLESEWSMVMCPIGKRCLVLTRKGQTVVYAKNGFFVNSFPSNLPGGNRKRGTKYTEEECTILDCIYSEILQTYYVLDVMCWNGHPVYDSETEFRFFWLNSKLQETPSLQVQSKLNPYKFVALPQVICTRETMQNAIAQPMLVALDGVLFYHKRTRYLFGSTPLVVWLKPYMLPELLGVSVPADMMKRVPSDYTNYSSYMQTVEEKESRRKEKKESRQREKLEGKSPKTEHMDTAPQNSENKT